MDFIGGMPDSDKPQEEFNNSRDIFKKEIVLSDFGKRLYKTKRPFEIARRGF